MTSAEARSFKTMRLIRTQRLRLVPVTGQKAALLWRLLQAPDLRMFQDLPNLSEGAFRAMVNSRPKRLRPGAVGRFEWLVYLHRMRRPAGWVSLRLSERDDTGEIGYTIVREFRGRGFATEAVAALLHEAFARGQLDRISAYCVPDNRPSRKVLARLGFREGALVHNGASVAGRAVDVLHHVIARRDWLQSAKTIEIPASA
ncbi:MAG: GNAT family N-acetyltransferase [Candidatus Eremiobacteraeota bacterium]|nr:GNAT family N-acetyltransferase [Candidatus Eremiobacteraeota bacterium]